jgi:hypothetical protein
LTRSHEVERESERVEQGADTEFVEKRINVSMNADGGLSLGSNAAMIYFGSFLLICLCFLAKTLYIKTGPINYLISYFNMFLSFPKDPVKSRKLS